MAATLTYASPAVPADTNRPVSPLRWVIITLLFLAAVLNYIDRSVLAILAPTIQKSLGISNERYAHVNDGFLIFYAIAYLVSGRVVEKLGTRISMALFIGFWSAANALTGFARSALSLSVFRSLLGLGEAGGWTASPAAVAEWFPAKERALATGLYSIGGTIGSTVAPLLVIATAGRFGWQAAFVSTGLLGFVWLIPWLILYRPRRAATIDIASAAIPLERPTERQLWSIVIRQPNAWRLMGARLLTDSVWFFFLFWMPKYLHDARGVSQTGLSIMWKIFLAADIGFIAGGFFSDRLVARGATPVAGRIWVLFASAVLIPCIVFVPLAPTLRLTLAAAMIVAFAHCMWLSNLTALVIDLIPRPIMATTFGLIAAGSAVGGIVMNDLVAWAVGHYSYDRCFYVMAFMHPLAAVLFILPIRRSRSKSAGLLAS
jgi:ACS family hexuronate transporter-like MFS transporter